MGEDETCWLWKDGVGTGGYGSLRVGGIPGFKAHRIAYELAHGEVPSGLCVRHKCDTPRCCNPAHLELGTLADNVQDRHVRGRNARQSGVANGRAKITPEDVRYIRANPDRLLQRELGEKFGMTQVNISAIQRRLTWADVD